MPPHSCQVVSTTAERDGKCSTCVGCSAQRVRFLRTGLRTCTYCDGPQVAQLAANRPKP